MNYQTNFFANRLSICPLLLALTLWAMPAGAENQPSLNLATAIERTLLQSPQLQQFPYQQRALEAQKLQAACRLIHNCRPIWKMYWVRGRAVVFPVQS